jgi:hypothetical protein
MRIIATFVLLALAGCAAPPHEQARAICADQGHIVGSSEYAACFNAAFPAFVADRSRMRAAILSAP